MDANPPTQRDERVSGAWGEVFLTYTTMPDDRHRGEPRPMPQPLRGGGKADKSVQRTDLNEKAMRAMLEWRRRQRFQTRRPLAVRRFGTSRLPPTNYEMTKARKAERANRTTG